VGGPGGGGGGDDGERQHGEDHGFWITRICNCQP
jgi:hypothetical protein